MESIEPNNSIATEETPEVPAPDPPLEAPPPKKKKLSEDRLTKRAKARERASQVAKEKRERKAMPSDDPIVVVEQDESDEDSFEGPPGILFVPGTIASPSSVTPSALAIVSTKLAARSLPTSFACPPTPDTSRKTCCFNFQNRQWR